MERDREGERRDDKASVAKWLTSDALGKGYVVHRISLSYSCMTFL